MNVLQRVYTFVVTERLGWYHPLPLTSAEERAALAKKVAALEALLKVR